MTPRHLAMFCLGQLGAIAAAILLARVCRKAYLKVLPAMGTESKFPAEANWFADYGWMLVAVPIFCVLIVPRHDAEAETPPMGLLPQGAIIAGMGVLVFAFWTALTSVLGLFDPRW